MIPMNKRFIIVLISIILIFSLFSGCTEEKKFNDSIKTIEPDITSYGEDWEILNYTYEINFEEIDDHGPTYGYNVPEYLFMRYLGENQSLNLFALKLDSTSTASEIYQKYTDTLMQHGVELDEGTGIGDQRIVAQTTFGGIPGNGIVFRRANCVFTLAGFTIDLNMILDMAQKIDSQILASLS